MQTAAEAELDRATALAEDDELPHHEPPPWRVAEVQVQENYELVVRFRNGLNGPVRMRELIFSQGAGVFAALRDVHLFAQAFVDQHWVAWPNGLDLAPDAMYEEIKAHGEWMLR